MEFPVLKASSRIAAKLNFLCPQFFPAPGFWPPQHVNSSMIDSPPLGEVGKCFLIHFYVVS